MGLFQTINLEAEKRGLNFLVIGGLAVNFHAYSRETADLDILICRDSREDWLTLFAQLGYAIDQEKGRFIQLLPPNQEAWPVDLMLVNKPTFEPMLKNGKEVELFDEKFFISVTGTFNRIKTSRVEAQSHWAIHERFSGCGKPRACE